MVGALAVVVTLIYLAKQIGQNTRAMEEARKLALAQTYQVRSDALQAMLVQAADSEFIGPNIIKLSLAMIGAPNCAASKMGSPKPSATEDWISAHNASMHRRVHGRSRR